MGVPGFFLWLLKKYKNKDLIFEKKDNLLENIDNLLFDTNCLIHPICFKVLSENTELKDNKNLEYKMIIEIIKYLEFIIDFINPNKFVYIAIDGVVPIAKIKQQRLRRYKSLADKELWNNIKNKHKIPLSNNWNNNAITPGTVFMDKLHKYIINWAKNYNKKQIIYSSYLTPGEGEHKLLEFIRNNKNDTHIIYGLDADLIFLSLSTGLSNIYLLREGSEINKYESKDIFKFVNINIMRTLIFNTIKEFLLKENNYIILDENNKNNIINDFIFMCYFIGNDFLPHIISLDIHNEGIEYLLINYTKTLNILFLENNNINFLLKITDNKIKFNNKFLILFIKNLSDNEDNILKYNFNNKKYINFNTKNSRNIEYEKEIFKIENLQFKIDDPILLGSDNIELCRERYYKHYWNIEKDNIEKFSKELVKDYLFGLKWVTLYYFDKCPSWDWYYPYEHPPFLYDIFKNINKINLNNIGFKLGNPIKPFLQLLIVLPPQSNYLLPINLRKIIYEDEVKNLYPYKFKQDFINKRKYWMGIPILPQLNINNINNIYLKYELNINDFDKNRNINNDKNYIFN